jgi:hypothetical protein
MANAQLPSTQVLVPSSGATVSGTKVVLDAGASGGTTQVQFDLTAGQVVVATATATPTYYGWIALWDGTTLGDGTYTLQSVASANGVSGTSTAITITVNNPPPSTTVLIPASGATLDTAQTLVFDAAASPGVTKVSIELSISGATHTFTTTPTIYGWIAVMPGTQCGPLCGAHSLSASVQSVASYLGGVSGTSPAVNVTIIVYVGPQI